MLKTNSLVSAVALSLSLFTAMLLAAPAAPAAPADSAKTTPAVQTPVSNLAPTPTAIVAVKDSAKDSTAVSVIAKDSSALPVVAQDSLPVPTTLAVDTTKPDSTKSASGKKRKRIVRETTVNSIDELKGRYRSPKKAMFMSLLLPGLGQTYVGQHWANYTRGAFYFLTDVALAYGWNYYVVVRQDQQIAKYRKYADANWRQSRYEVFLSNHITPFDQEKFDVINAHRESYCDAVQNTETVKGSGLHAGCIQPNESNYQAFQVEYDDEAWSTDSTTLRRKAFVDPHAFYELIGKEVEFITGWNDADKIDVGDSTFFIKGPGDVPAKDNAGRILPATTLKQQEYITMRAKANDYARMQAYFLGGMVVNHLVSALDAALTAHYHNKTLYQTEVRWWDRVHLDGGLAWQGLEPATTITAHVTF